MRKTSSYIIFIGTFCIVVCMFLDFSHMHELAQYFNLFFIFLMIIGFSMRLFIPNMPGMPYSTFFKSRYRLAHRLVDAGFLLLFIGFLRKRLYYAGSELLIQLALLVLVGGGIFLWWMLRTKNEYFLPSSMDSILSSADLEKYAGIYACEQLMTEIAITVVDNHLFGQMKGQGVFRVSAVKEDIFNNLTLKVVIEFYPARNELVLIQHGGYFTFVKH